MSEGPLTRGAVYALINHYRLAGPGQVTDDQVTTWLRELRGYTAGECHAALTAMAGHRDRPVTAAEITVRIDAARANPAGPVHRTAAVPRPRDRAADRARAKAAGARGISAVYGAMGWARNPDHDQARAVMCPFCRAGRGEACAPMVRNRHGKRETRDPATRMHPSRLAATRAANNPVEAR